VTKSLKHDDFHILHVNLTYFSFNVQNTPEKMATAHKSGVVHQYVTFFVIKHENLTINTKNVLSVAHRTSPPLPTTRPQSRFYNMPISNFKLNSPLMLMPSDLIGPYHCFTAVCYIFTSIYQLIHTNTCEIRQFVFVKWWVG
jgi:hypothetical protein